ncbi:hypothetical protein VTJ04DRAFT_10093 [Mycothermus thermophilus]|uniref:uncharacterized protein n=1 Tax=Humicola insolens TaxID=85995 RepID=UPI0037438907
MATSTANKPEVGDILVVIHDFTARSSDELTLAKGDRVELLERDDEFGDGWYLGRHVVTGASGLFPEVYTRPERKLNPNPAVVSPKPSVTSSAADSSSQQTTTASHPSPETNAYAAPAATTSEAKPISSASPLGSFKSSPPPSASSVPSYLSSSLGNLPRPSTSADSHVLHETLNVINEHITDFNTPVGAASIRNGNDSGSEYSSHMGTRVSYIHGEETDEEEEETMHTREEVEAWTADQVAEYLFTVGVEKHHCEVFRDQEITGEVLLGMDQTSVFIKALDLGSVGRRLKTWQKIKQLQDEVAGLGGYASGRTTQNYGSDAGSERVRSRTNTLTSSNQRFTPLHDMSMKSGNNRRTSSQAPRVDPYEPISPVSPLAESPNRTFHDKRPSAASVRDLHHSRRHSSTDFRVPGPSTLHPSGAQPQSSYMRQDGSHRKQPSFDRNWTLGSATAQAAQRPLSSHEAQDSLTGFSEPQDSAVDIDRGYFSGTDADSRKRNTLKKRDSLQTGHKASYAEEQRVRSGTAMSRHSRLGSVESVRDSTMSPAAQKYYGMSSKRSPSTATVESLKQPIGTKETAGYPTVTRLDSNASDQSRSSAKNSLKRLSQVNHPDFNVAMMLRSGLGGLRSASDAVSSGSGGRDKLSPTESKESPMYSPARTGSSTRSAGPSFELDSPDVGKSPSTTTTATTGASRSSGRKKTKQETSAYTRGLQKISPAEAIKDADFSGWMKKRSANLMATWKPRLFVLKGRRLAYYYSENDDQERGLIDISFHRVLPADNERLTGLHATLTGASNSTDMPSGSQLTAADAADADRQPEDGSDSSIFIFKLVPPRAGLSRAVNFTKPTVHYFAVPNVKQGRLWMAALMKATIERDDTQPVSSSYQQKTISLAKARQMRHRPPALMGLDDGNPGAGEEKKDGGSADQNAGKDGSNASSNNGLGIVYDGVDSAAAGLEKLGLHQHSHATPGSARTPRTGYGGLGSPGDKDSSLMPQSA